MTTPDPDDLDVSLSHAQRNAFERPKLLSKLVDILKDARSVIVTLRTRVGRHDDEIAALKARVKAAEDDIKAIKLKLPNGTASTKQ